MKCLLHKNAQRSIFPSAAILCTVFLFKWVRDLLQNSIFYVTVRTRSAWPIFGAPWRQCFSSVHWKPWLRYFITISQRLQRIRRWSYEEHQLSARADCGEELPLISLAEHVVAWHRTWYGLNSRFVIPRCRILQIPQKAVFPHYSGVIKMSCYTGCRADRSVWCAFRRGCQKSGTCSLVPPPSNVSHQGASLDSCCSWGCPGYTLSCPPVDLAAPQ